MSYPVEILTLFPGMLSGYLGASILGKAQEKGLFSVTLTDVRDFAVGKHHVTDDSPYGGGAGMVMKPEPLVAAIEAARARLPGAKALLMSPRGPVFTQATARELVRHEAGLILVCGRYEGVDERVMPYLDGELSLGDFVLTGGEIAAMAVVDAVTRLVPGVLGNEASSVAESFEEGLLEYPHYTRPPVFRGVEVPAVLQSGDHARIARWRRWKAIKLTQQRRPDLYSRLEFGKADQKLLARGEEEL
ncbi:tRNA (guanosine(37)-N1)-methyltransferase TrmD [Corallococcus praedator]|uniref:tRNA (guanine-N(1)-)-methyltransferase n=1 Tax=Corallococcus praedator TaxID=2316724 RepID=A0ABX9QQ30_9BACT|nr:MULTISPECIES: tRNA (guanosine(37)-N1)-methyltransferase TrmD [Corallococcus]RKH21868.1 tRNA (guanosine(37)-N1)-methyltransferase TrmD [Corallococcus sp. CA047B]RKH36459.1 tRNA (guanosine(37)-N1)-methyltransferase TrmD [Corallococcus sp. CA031C]RKI16294.1 tRNA (guanosine(37)-N1)-methyltransferase TrmD [Corallococcus praedator]